MSAVVIDIVSKFNEAGISKARNELDKLANSTKTTSQKMMQGAAVAGAGILAGAGAIGVALYGIGTQFDDAFDRIRIGTGATGDALESLKGDMKAVAGAVPASFADAGTAITEFNRRLGLTGDPLQMMSKQILELSRMTKTDLSGNIAAVAQVMQNFGVSTVDQSGKLDVLFRASQKSGVSVADLATEMSGAGVVLRDLGFGFDQAAALLATLGKAGIDTGDVMPALSKSLAVAAKQGKDAATVFSETFATIKNAPSDVAASGIALDVFGAKAGPKLAAMIREGKLSYEDMTAALANGDSILKASKDTQDFGEKLTTLKNRVFLAIEPIATRVFNAIGDAMDKIGPKVEQLTKWFQEHEGVAKVLAIAVGVVLVAALAAFTASLFAAGGALAFVMSPIALIVGAIAAFVAAWLWAFNNIEWFHNAVVAYWKAISTAAVWAWEHVIQPAWKALSWYIENVLVPWFKILWTVAKAVFEKVAAAVSWAWENVIKPAWTAISWYVENVLVPELKIIWAVAKEVWDKVSAAVMAAWENVIQPIWDTIYNYVKYVLIPVLSAIWDKAKEVWDNVSAQVSDAWNNVIKPIWDTIYNYVTYILIPVLSAIWDKAQEVWNDVSAVVSAAWNYGLSPIFENIKGGIATLIYVFSTIKDGVANAFSSLWGIIVDPVKGAINWIIDKWNALEFEVPKVSAFGQTVGGWKIDTPDIPRFDSGGIFNTAMSGGAGLAILHDNEMVLNPQQQKALFGADGLAGGPSVSVVINTVAGDPAAIERVVLDAIGRAHVRGMTALRP